MSNGQKALVGALVLVVALFALSVGTQGRADGATDPAHSGLVGLLTAWLGNAAAVEPAELSGSCVQGGRLTVELTCTVAVAASSRGLRQLHLRSEGSAVRITAPIPRGSGTADKDLQPGETATVAVDGTGARVTIMCEGVSVCFLTVAASG